MLNVLVKSSESQKKHKIRIVKQTIVGYLYAMPVILGILFFTAFPVIYSLISSFFDVTMGVYHFENFGIQNYIKPFTPNTNESLLFWKSIKVTFSYALINIPLTLILSFALAMFLNQKVRGMNFFRVLYYLPVLLPAVCSGLVWKNFTSKDYGIANELLAKIGLPAYSWFNEAATAMPSFIFIGLFTVGGGMILWLAQLKNVPSSMYESAKLDGAGWFRQLFSITIPLCTPMIFYNIVMSLIATLQTFAQVQTLVPGGSGPSYSLHFYLMNVYGEAFGGYNMGYGAALSFILMLIIGVFTLIVFKSSKWVYYGEDA